MTRQPSTGPRADLRDKTQRVQHVCIKNYGRLTATELAERLGVSRSKIYRIWEQARASGALPNANGMAFQ